MQPERLRDSARWPRREGACILGYIEGIYAFLRIAGVFRVFECAFPSLNRTFRLAGVPFLDKWRKPGHEGGDLTGMSVWDASFGLARWLCTHQRPSATPFIKKALPPLRSGQSWELWEGKSMVELGAGLGLVSIVAGRSVILVELLHGSL